jgi:hypothetical protein
LESRYALIKGVRSDVHERLIEVCTAVALYAKRFDFVRTALCAVASPVSFSAPICAVMLMDIVRNVQPLIVKFRRSSTLFGI